MHIVVYHSNCPIVKSYHITIMNIHLIQLREHNMGSLITLPLTSKMV